MRSCCPPHDAERHASCQAVLPLDEPAEAHPKRRLFGRVVWRGRLPAGRRTSHPQRGGFGAANLQENFEHFADEVARGHPVLHPDRGFIGEDAAICQGSLEAAHKARFAAGDRR